MDAKAAAVEAIRDKLIEAANLYRQEMSGEKYNGEDPEQLRRIRFDNILFAALAEYETAIRQSIAEEVGKLLSKREECGTWTVRLDKVLNLLQPNKGD